MDHSIWGKSIAYLSALCPYAFAELSHVMGHSIWGKSIAYPLAHYMRANAVLFHLLCYLIALVENLVRVIVVAVESAGTLARLADDIAVAVVMRKVAEVVAGLPVVAALVIANLLQMRFD